MTATTNKKFPWKKGIILLLFLMNAVVGYDIYKHGNFQDSHTGKFLKKSGLAMYGQNSWIVVQGYSSKALEFIEATSPEYYKATVETCRPYIKLSGDVYLVVRNISFKLYNNIAEYAEKSGPLVVQTIEHYVPGILDKVKTQSSQVLEFVKVSFNLYAEKLNEYSITTIQWLKKNVFIGKLSPESLQNYALKAIDTTQTLASQTYDWVYEKVQTLSKVP